MFLIEKISIDMKTALKAQDALKLEALRFILAALQARQKEIAGSKSAVLGDEEAVKVLQREAKKRKEAITLYDTGNRPELSRKEKFELGIIQSYLPAEMSQEQIGKIIDSCIKAGAKEFPALMKAVMAKTAGQADGKVVSELIKKKIG
jgi:uncharacterized protein YqeY